MADTQTSDFTSRVPYYTFDESLAEQEAQLAANPPFCGALADGEHLPLRRSRR